MRGSMGRYEESDGNGTVKTADTSNAGSDGLPRLFFTITEVGQMLGLSDKTVRRLIARKLLKTCNAVRCLRITAQSIQDFIKSTTQ